MRWWDGQQWTAAVSAAPPPAAAQGSSRGLVITAVWALLVIGVILAFQSVSLVSGTTTVWVGVALTIVGAIVTFVGGYVGTATKVIAVVLVVVCVANAVYDEVQLNHRQDQLNNLFNGSN